jgi:hypothetical protein
VVPPWLGPFRFFDVRRLAADAAGLSPLPVLITRVLKVTLQVIFLGGLLGTSYNPPVKPIFICS